MVVLFSLQQLLILFVVAVICPVGLSLYLTKRASAVPGGLEAIQLSQEHYDAVNRRRRIVVQYDAFSQLGVDFKQWLDYRFSYADEPGNQIDSFWWDIGAGSWAVYPSKILERFEHPGLKRWWDQGIDWVQALVDESRKRNLEVFWNHRVSEVDISPTVKIEPGHTLMMDKLNPVKKTHPDWVIKTWWWQGLWNYAVPEVRQYQLDILRELAENYEFDGIQLDFARHVPCLPPGRQWELRDNITEFVRMVRLMSLEVEKKRGWPFLLAAKVPRNLEGCRMDGFDVETWAQQNLVDIFTLGSRSMDVDLSAFRRITAGQNIKLQTCFDDHHATDGYQYGPIEFLRGVFGNWWQQGADSVVTFNWSNAPPDVCKKIGATPGPLSHRQAYHEVGSPETLAYKDKIFAVERRGGYPWAEGFFGRNDTAPLPVTLANDGRPAGLTVGICDNVRAYSDKVKQITLRAVLFGAREGDEFEVRLNGVALPLAVRDYQWKDKNIFSPAPQPASGGADSYRVNPDQKLLRLDFTVPPRQCRPGENQINICIVARAPYLPGVDIVLEKLEVHVDYD
jgi:hypothetical protein